MHRENSAEFACGKILFVLKNSNLNYKLNETPYSAYITVRKKFVRDTLQNLHQEPVIEATNLDDKENELRTLRNMNNDLKTRLALATVEYEEMEVQKEKWLSEKLKHEDTIEHFMKTEKKMIGENDDLKRTIDHFETDVKELREKNESLDSEKSELDDRVEELFREVSDSRQKLTEEMSVNNTKMLEKRFIKNCKYRQV